jgi:secretory phospholipase A2
MKIKEIRSGMGAYVIFAVLLSMAAADRPRQASCPAGQSLVQVLDKPIESNGCSKPEFLTVQGEEDFTYCCDRHDLCYATCGAPKDFCEQEFKRCMHRMCKELFSHNAECRGAADTYVMGTTLMGGGGYEALQREHCECMDSSKVLSHYQTYAESIYSAHAPEQFSKAAAAISNPRYSKNSGTQQSPVYSSMYRLVYDLHKKYDGSIVHVDGRKGRTVPALTSPPSSSSGTKAGAGTSTKRETDAGTLKKEL